MNRVAGEQTPERKKAQEVDPPGLFTGLFLAKQLDIRQCPTLPHGYPCSTIGAEGLYFCVRHGNRCGPFAITTGIRLYLPSGKHVLLTFESIYLFYADFFPAITH
jgi:hypothetical protein